jgi:peptide deformylase
MIKRILNYRNEEDKEILSQKSETVENIDEVKDLIQDLKDTLHAIPDAKGLSAIQLGINKRICICS